MQNTPNRIQEYISSFRKQRAVSLRGLQASTGISYATIYNWERGLAALRVEALLGVDESKLDDTGRAFIAGLVDVLEEEFGAKIQKVKSKVRA